MHIGDPTSALKHLKLPHIQPEQPDTRHLLEAGLQLVTEMLEGCGEENDGPVRFQWPTEQQVIDRYNQMLGLRRTKAILQQRWKSISDYYSDLFGWALHRGQWSAHQQVASRAAAMLTGAASFSDVAQRVATADITVLLSTPNFRIMLLVCATCPSSSTFHPVMADFFEAANNWWGAVYREILAAAGLKLRSGIDETTFAMLMTGLEEGLALRFLAHPASFRNDLREVARVLKSGALALLLGASAHPGDGVTLEDVVNARMSTHAGGEASKRPAP